MQWLRWYRGTTEDAKFRFIAKHAGVSVGDAIAVWAVLLEDASALTHRGIVTRDEDWIQAVLDLGDGVAEDVLAAMQIVDMISVGHGAITICNWSARQYESDIDKTAAERQKRHRERAKATTKGGSASDGHVTRDSRVSHGHVTAPDTDTDTDTDTDKKEGKKGVERAARAAPKASRWPVDAVVPEDWLSKAETERANHGFPQIDLRLEATKFANYWASKSGGSASKTSWERTWINWILKAENHGKSNGQHGAIDPASEVFRGNYLRARAQREGSGV